MQDRVVDSNQFTAPFQYLQFVFRVEMKMIHNGKAKHRTDLHEFVIYSFYMHFQINISHE